MTDAGEGVAQRPARIVVQVFVCLDVDAGLAECRQDGSLCEPETPHARRRNAQRQQQADLAGAPLDAEADGRNHATGEVAHCQQAALGTEVSCGVGGTQFCNGSGQCVGCTIDADCGTHPGPCSTFSCIDDVCEVESITNAPSPKQTPEDCQTVHCDARGMPVQDVDDTDVPVDLDPMDCVTPICTFDGMIDSEPLLDGATCGEPADNRQCCAGTCCALGQTCETSSSTCQ